MLVTNSKILDCQINNKIKIKNKRKCKKKKFGKNKNLGFYYKCMKIKEEIIKDLPTLILHIFTYSIVFNA